MVDELSIIRSHHEKWDGTGYPDRLSGESIPMLARIVAVADVYDALTSNRSYRKAWPHEDAIKLIKAGIGSHFDPASVQAWLRACERDPNLYRYMAASSHEECSLRNLQLASGAEPIAGSGATTTN